MYTVYLFKEKSTDEIIYVGSTARPSARMKEHLEQMSGKRDTCYIHEYMNSKGLELYKDVSIIWEDIAEDRDGMLDLEEHYYFKYIDTVKNHRPGENTSGKYNPRSRKVRCITEDLIFDTVTECAEYYGKPRTTLSHVMNGRKDYLVVKDKGRLFFEYL